MGVLEREGAKKGERPPMQSAHERERTRSGRCDENHLHQEHLLLLLRSQLRGVRMHTRSRMHAHAVQEPPCPQPPSICAHDLSGGLDKLK